jgi:low temperature requirement protein LtrA
MLVGIVLPDGPDWILYGAAIVLLVVPTSLRTPQGRPVPAIDPHHLAERAALLTLIVMGESFVKSALVITAGEMETYDVIAIVVLFVILFGLFSSYFDDIPLAGIRPGALSGEVWLLAHLIVQISIVAMAVGAAKYLQLEGASVPTKAVVILMIAYAGIFVGLAIVSEFDQRFPRWVTVEVHLAAAALAVMAGAATLATPFVTPGMFLISLAVISVGDAVVSRQVRRRTVVLAEGVVAPAPLEEP